MRISCRSSERANCPKAHSRTMRKRMALFIVDEEAIGNLAHRNRCESAIRAGIDDDDVIGQPVSDIELLLVSGEGQAPGPLAHQHIVENLAARDIDDSDMIGTAEGDIGARSILGHHEIDRRHLLLSHSLGEKLDRAGYFEAREIDDVYDAPYFARNPQ